MIIYNQAQQNFRLIDPNKNTVGYSFKDYKLKLFIEKLCDISNNPIPSGNITPGLLFSSEDTIIFEKPPTYKNLFIKEALVDNISEETSEHAYTVPVPWQVYVIKLFSHTDQENQKHYSISDVYMYFSNSPITSFDQEVYMAPFPNFWTNGSLCRPFLEKMEDAVPSELSISAIINMAYQWIWQGGTNLDLTESCYSGFYQMLHHSTPNVVNTIPDMKDILSHYTYQGYYISYNVIDRVLKNWEKYTTENICELSWPTNSKKKRFAMDQNITLVSEWLPQYSAIFPDSGICETCNYYDDDQGEYFRDYDFCTEDCECECDHQEYLSYHINYNSFFEWCVKETTAYQPLTLSQLFKLNFFTPDSHSYLPTIVKDGEIKVDFQLLEKQLTV